MQKENSGAMDLMFKVLHVYSVLEDKDENM